MSDPEVPRCIWNLGALLGEGPLWSSRESCLYFLDIKRPALHRWSEVGKGETIPLKNETGAIALRECGELVAAMRSGFALLDPRTGKAELLASPEADLPDNRFNDGECDPQGRFWAASMDDRGKVPSGQLWRLSSDGRIERKAGGFIVGNGLGWSLDGGTMYFTDSENRTILAYDFDQTLGELGSPRIFARTQDGEGLPDGLTVDAEDHVWSAHWDGWRVTRYRPDGSIERVIDCPVPRPTSLAFGGRDLDRLYITSASIDLSKEQLAAAPLSGGLFEMMPGVRGRPSFPFRG
jgi:sugar lactone lactonase YvrE